MAGRGGNDAAQELDDAGGAEVVEHLEGAVDPVEAPADGVVDVRDVVRDLGHEARRVGQRAAEDVPSQLALGRVGEHHLAEVGGHAIEVGR